MCSRRGPNTRFYINETTPVPRSSLVFRSSSKPSAALAVRSLAIPEHGTRTYGERVKLETKEVVRVQRVNMLRQTKLHFIRGPNSQTGAVLYSFILVQFPKSIDRIEMQIC